MSARTSNPIRLACAGTMLLLIVVSVPAQADTRSADYPRVIAADEIRLGGMLPSQPAHDAWVALISNSAGDICALTLENFRLRSALSVDGGATFAPEIEVAGGSGQPAVFSVTGDTGPDGAVYLALQVADPGGHYGLQVVRSTDFCGSWFSPYLLVQSGAPSHGVSHVATSANVSGRWAIYFHGADGEDAYVIASSNGGSIWSAPVRLDGGPPPLGSAVVAGSVAVDSAGVIYASYVDLDGDLPVTWYTRSTDGGLTFEASRRIRDLMPLTGLSNTHPHLAVAADGSILLALWDSAPRLYVARSIDQGVNYTISYYHELTDPQVPLRPRLFPGDNGDVFLLAVDESARLTLHRSLGNGEGFLFREYVTTSAYGVDAFTMARTPAGKWVLAWSENGADSYVGDLTDVFAKTSPNRGDTWSTPQQVHGGDAGSARRVVQPSSLTAHGAADDFLITWLDDRDAGNGVFDVYGSSGTATPWTLTLGPDRRIDTDAVEPVSPPVSLIPTMATDGVDHVYVAFSASGAGPHPDIYVASSGDGGYTFSSPTRVGDTLEGEYLEWFPALTALPDGHVFLAWLADDPGGTGREIRVNHSTDYGANWAGDYVLGTLNWPAGYGWTLDWPALQIAAVPGGKVYVVGAGGDDVHIVRSITAGLSWEPPEEIDQDDRGLSGLPRICADGDQVVVAYVSPRALDDTARSIWAVVSEDGGVTWDARVELRDPSRAGNIANGIDLACGPGGSALASWSEIWSPLDDYRVHARLFDGSVWQSADVEVAAPLVGASAFWPSAAFAGANQVVLAYQVSDYDIYTARSIDGGVTWPSYLKMDDYNPNPDSPPLSYWPQTVSDGNQNVWVSWLDRAAGRPSVVMRRSADGGSSFFLTTRLDRTEPQGVHDSLVLPMFGASAALPGVGFVARAAVRDSPVLYDVVLNGWDRDDYDRDTAPDSVDCAPTEPGAFALPPEIVGPALAKPSGIEAELTWNSLASTAGEGTTYDIVSGRLSDLRSGGMYAAASCLENDLTEPGYTDFRTDPPGGDADYYLVRGQNVCGLGSFGDSGLTADPRDALDDFYAPCP